MSARERRLQVIQSVFFLFDEAEKECVATLPSLTNLQQQQQQKKRTKETHCHSFASAFHQTLEYGEELHTDTQEETIEEKRRRKKNATKLEN